MSEKNIWKVAENKFQKSQLNHIVGNQRLLKADYEQTETLLNSNLKGLKIHYCLRGTSFSGIIASEGRHSGALLPHRDVIQGHYCLRGTSFRGIIASQGRHSGALFPQRDVIQGHYCLTGTSFRGIIASHVTLNIGCFPFPTKLLHQSSLTWQVEVFSDILLLDNVMYLPSQFGFDLFWWDITRFGKQLQIL